METRTVEMKKSKFDLTKAYFGTLAFLLVLSALLAESPPSTNLQGSPARAEQQDWISVGGDRGHMRYSALDQINRKNVDSLQVVWTYHTGELKGRRGKIIECTPIVVDGVMYITTAYRKVVALDAASGRQLWRFDPPPHPTVGDGKLARVASAGVNRGVAYWSDGKEGGERRILHGSADSRLFSLDARTGEPDQSFGQEGILDLREGIERDISRLRYAPTSAPAIYQDVVILGFSSDEGPGPVAPGDMRAFDVRSGREVWRFHTIPRPGEFGNDTWEGDSWRDRGGANAWGGASVDEKRGMVFVGLGSAAYDFYGGDRKGKNLFANSVVALDASTGRRIWHFQTLHHDLWDHDLPVYPNLVRVTHAGRQIDAVAQVGKRGYVFLFDRVTGKPLFEIEERPVPPSDVPGEEAWPTQPIPVKPPPFARQAYGEDDLTNISEQAHDAALKQYRKIRASGAFNPPSLQGTLVVPGFYGGAGWPGASFDPTTGVLYVNSNNVLHILTLVEAEPGKGYPYKRIPSPLFRDADGYPANEPPWGVLTAIDLNQGEFRWQVPLGEYPELTARGVPPTGTLNFGGTIVTAGGLVFIGATRDEKFHAFDKATGKLLWEYALPAGGYATPSTYMVDGRQFVVIAAGGAGYIGTPAGDSFVTFALPSSTPPTEP